MSAKKKKTEKAVVTVGANPDAATPELRAQFRTEFEKLDLSTQLSDASWTMTSDSRTVTVSARDNAGRTATIELGYDERPAQKIADMLKQYRGGILNLNDVKSRLEFLRTHSAPSYCSGLPLDGYVKQDS